ncbi:hypothetical protein [Nitrincola sp. MINF-07-Sa-05]|uniref:hypothetical protein n=1 Tax=Nitrincola salilacus TaxID=3400273 RepID=UPI00391835BB
MENLSVLDDKDVLRQISSKVAPPDPLVITPENVVIYRTKVAQLWIEEDIRRGVLPADLGSLSDAHDYVDSNMYLLEEGHPCPRVGSLLEWREWDFWAVCHHSNLVIDALNDWLRNGHSGDASENLKLQS